MKQLSRALLTVRPVDVEKFHSFREVHSLEWHAHRHELGQRFLDQFVRQVRTLSDAGNVTDI